MRTLTLLFVILTTTVVSSQELPDDIMLIADVRPGMLATVRSSLTAAGPADYPARVVSLVHTNGSYPKVMIRVDMPFAREGDVQPILRGMSGSPVYVGGKIIGALERTDEGLINGHAWVTPIELALRHIPSTREQQVGMLRDAPVPDVFSPGDVYMACSLWGEELQSCIGATITYQLGPNRWYVQGHSSRPYSVSGIAHGHVAVPIWKATTRDLLLSRIRGSLIAEREGDPIGMLVWDNEFGGVIVTDYVPKSIPVTVSVKREESTTHTFSVSHEIRNSSEIMGSLNTIGDRYFGIDECLWVDARIDVQGLPGGIVLRDVGLNFDRPKHQQGLLRMLNWLFMLTRPRPDVQGIALDLEKATSCELLTPTAAFTEMRPESGPSLRVRFTRKRDSRQMISAIPASTAALVPGAPLFIYDGVDIQNFLLSQLPLEQAVAILNEHPNRAALYLVTIYDETPAQPAPGDVIPEGWETLTRQLSVVGELDLHGLAGMTPNQGVEVRGRFR